jgi:hypothetical protein
MKYVIILIAIPCLALAWSDPIMVTPDSSSNRKPRVVFDQEGNTHFFFISNRGYYIPYGLSDVYYCKFSRNGVKMTEDVRLDTTNSLDDTSPSPVYGSDGKLHVVWDENVSPGQDLDGIYYSRLDTDGNIERYATRIFECSSERPRLFEDSEGFLNVVWVIPHDTLYYGKFDTSGQVIIPKTPVYAPGSGEQIWYMRASIDNQNVIHCIYKNYYGTWNEFNLGYSSVNNQGEVIVPYYPLTPESPYSCSPIGHLVADESGDLHLSYLLSEYGETRQRYRKMDRDLNTIYDFSLATVPPNGQNIGDGDIELDGNGNIMIIFVYIEDDVDFYYIRITYSTNGEVLIPPEIVIDEVVFTPDLAVNSNGMAVFTYRWSEESIPGSEVFYSYVLDQLMVEKVKPDRAFYSDKVGESMVLREEISQSASISISPNPANPITWISFSLPAPQEATLAVYNISGAKVTTLASGLQMPGTHNYIWNASQYSSGVYIICLETGQWMEVGRVAVVK